MFEKEAFEEWKSEQYKDQSTEERLEFVEHLHTFPKYFEKAFKDGYNKANEWHYPSKGELPKCDEKTQLIFYVNCYYEIDGKTITRKRTVLGNYKKSFLNDDIKLFVEKSKGYEDEYLPKNVIAWKEIVLPELKESE